MNQPILSCNVAGVSHATPDFNLLNAEDEVTLILEPHNQFDPNAIRVQHLLAGKLGYVPAESTLPIHVAIANGLAFKSKITGVNPEGRYPKIRLVVSVEI